MALDSVLHDTQPAVVEPPPPFRDSGEGYVEMLDGSAEGAVCDGTRGGGGAGGLCALPVTWTAQTRSLGLGRYYKGAATPPRDGGKFQILAFSVLQVLDAYGA